MSSSFACCCSKNALMSSSSFFVLAFFCSRAIALEAFCASVRRAGGGRGLRTGRAGFRAAHVVLFDSTRGVTWGDDSREREERFAGGDGGSGRFSGGGDGGGSGRELGISPRAGSMSLSRTMFRKGS